MTDGISKRDTGSLPGGVGMLPAWTGLRRLAPTAPPLAHVVSLLLLPWAVTLAVPDWFYSDPLGIDPWLYTGFFRFLHSFTATQFPDTYYGTRLGWILPGHVAYSLFAAPTATFVLHLVFYMAAVFALYGLLRQTTDGPRSLFGAMAFGTYLPAIRCLGDDYVAAAVVTYALWAMLFTLYAARSGRAVHAAAGGACAAAMFHSNIVAALLYPTILLWLVPLSASKASWRRAARLLGWWCAGVVLCTVAFGEISAAYGGRRLFFVRSFTWMLENGSSNPWDFRGAAWVVDRPWAFVPFACAVAAMTAAVRRRQFSEPQTRWLTAFGVLFATYVAWEFGAGGAPLAYDYYASWLLPTTFGVLVGVVAWRQQHTVPLPATLAAAAALLGAIAMPGALTPISMWVTPPLLIAAAWVAAGWTRNGWLSLALVTLGLAVVNGWTAPVSAPGVKRAEVFRVADQAVAHVARHIGTLPPRFVATQGTPHAPYFNATAAIYLWGYSVVTWDYPTLTAEDAAQMPEGALVTIFADSPGQIDVFNAASAAHGLRGRLVEETAVATTRGPFYLAFVRIEPEPSDMSEGIQ